MVHLLSDAHIIGLSMRCGEGVAFADGRASGAGDRENGPMGRVRLVRGHGVQLVRWRAVEHGWVADVRRGRRVAEDADGWTVLIGGRNQRFERSEWTEFIGELQPPSRARPAARGVRPDPGAPADGAGAQADARASSESRPGERGQVSHPRSTTLREVPTTRPIMEPPAQAGSGHDDADHAW
jgi:hypothetical protein